MNYLPVSSDLRVPKPTSQHFCCLLPSLGCHPLSPDRCPSLWMVLPISNIIICNSLHHSSVHLFIKYVSDQIYPNGFPLPLGESASSQLWQIKPSQPIPHMASPVFVVLEAFSKQNDLKRHKHDRTGHALLMLGCCRSCCLCLGELSPSWLILQLTSFPCPLNAGSMGPSGQVGPSLHSHSVPGDHHHSTSSDCVGSMLF